FVIDSDDAEVAVRAFKNGAADYLVKDRMTPDDLRLSMRSAIENAELRRELQRTQEQFQTSVENMLDCFGIFSAMRDESGQIVDFRIDYLNGAACENNRMPKAMQIGRGLCEVLPAHRESGLFDEYCRLVETAEPLIEDSLIYDDTYGEQHLVRAFDIRATKLNDGFVASWRDVTDRKRLELKLSHTVTDLQQHEAAIQHLNRDLTNRVVELQSLLDIIPVGIAIATDPSCTQMQNNAYLRQLLGVDPGSNISKSAPADEQPPYRVFQDGREVPAADLPMQVAVRLGIDVRDAEFDILLADGRVHQLLSYATPLRDDQNQIRGVIGAFLDITERNQDAAALKASQQRYRQLAEAMPQMVWTADATGAVNYCNQRWYEYTGLNEAESMGLAAAHTVHPDERDRSLTQWSEAIANGQSFEVEYRICHWGGEYQWFICRAIPTRDTQNQITGWIGTITNIDDIKRSEALVQQSEQQLQRQLAEIEAIYQSAPIGLNVLDTDLRFVRINQRLADINGLPIEAHIGRTVRELFPNLADTAEQLLHPILTTGEPLLNIEIQGETPAQPGIKRTWLEHFLPLKAGERVVGISTVCEEITERIEVEAALRQSEERFRHMADNAPVMIWVTDATGYCTYLNQGWYDFTGQTEETGLGFGWLDAAHPEDSESSKNVFLSATHRQEAFRLEYRLRRKDGKYRSCIDAASPWFGEDGEFKGYIGSVIDISDRKQAEEALRVSEERYRTLFENMNEGFCVAEVLFDEHNKPIDYRLLEINSVFEKHSGLKDAQGKTARELHPELEQYWIDLYGNVVLTGEPVRYENYSEALNRWFDVSSFRIGPPGSRKVAILFEDISKRKQTERELQESEMRFRTLADNISQFAWMADENGWIFWYNQRWFDYTGTTLEEMEGWGWQKVHHPNHVDRVVEKISRCFETGETWEDTFPLRGKDGQYRWFLSRAIPVRDEQGKVLRWFGTNTDITERKQTEAALQASEERYRSLIEATAQIIWNEQGAQGEFTTPQPAWSAFTGQTYDELKGWGWLNAVHPDDRAMTTQAWLIALENRALYEVEHRLRRHDGVYRHMSVRAVPVFEENGSIREWIGVHTDVTDRKQAEAALHQSEDRLRMAIESAQLGTWDWNLITNKLTWDAGCKAMFGLPPNAESSIEVFFEGLHPDDRERLEQVVQWSFNPASSGNYDTEYRTIGIQDGIERWIAAKGQAYFDAAGNPIRFIGTVMNITETKRREAERKQAEEARRESEIRFGTLASHAPVGIFMTDPEGNCLYVNERWCEMAGMSLEAAQATGWVSALHPDDRERVADLWYQAAQNKQVFAAEYRFQTPQGKVTWIQGSATALQRGTGELTGYLGTLTDITDRKQAEAEREQLFQQEQAAREAAERANRIKDEFLAVLSHELRSPLNPILGWTKLLQMRKFDETKTAAALATIERNARVQTQLIDDLLDVAKILRGKLSLNVNSVNLSSAIEAAIDTVRTAAVAKSISLHPVLPNIGQVSGDAARLQQIVWNLLSNAIKFTPNGGRINIQLNRVGNQAEFTVKDTGRGINPDFLPHIFESFRQEDASITRQYGGLGLGLAIVRQLVEAHGGTITADSLGEELGATFTVRLPLLDVVPEIQHTDALPQDKLDLIGIRVLAVDDDPDARDLLTALLSQYGADVLTVTSAVEVLENLASFQPDVLVSDIGMPGVDGYTLIQQVRALPSAKGGEIPAIALTAYAREDDRDRAISSGFQRHVIKPLEPEQLVQAVLTLTRRELNYSMNQNYSV
ncbi:MAG: PAS domain S-box protein, partial [Microcoleus sp. SIO2G3]|nr:PAS domain S-box protein [Microcoleus sp. SIO2G3]